jgi:hypothetical protein
VLNKVVTDQPGNSNQVYINERIPQSFQRNKICGVVQQKLRSTKTDKLIQVNFFHCVHGQKVEKEPLVAVLSRNATVEQMQTEVLRLLKVKKDLGNLRSVVIVLSA